MPPLTLKQCLERQRKLGMAPDPGLCHTPRDKGFPGQLSPDDVDRRANERHRVPLRREDGIIRKILKGDQGEATKHISAGRALLGQLKSFLSYKGLSQGRWRRTLKGVAIEVGTFRGQDWVAIEAGDGALSAGTGAPVFDMESGLLIIPLRASGAVSGGPGITLLTFELDVDSTKYPLEVFCGEDLAAYFGGPGSALPGYSNRRYIIWSDPDTGGPCFSWVDTFTLGPKDEYISRVYARNAQAQFANLATTSPSDFSGKMRLLQQSLMGAGRPPFPVSGALTGLFHDGSYNYWLIHMADTGCFAQRIFHDPKADCIHEWLDNGTVSDAAERLRLEAVLLSQMATAGEAVQILTASELEGVYGDSKGHFMHGWKFSRQIDEAGITETSIITARVHEAAGPTCWYLTTLSKVVFDVGTTVITATVTVESKDNEFYLDPVGSSIFRDGRQLCWTGEPCLDPTAKGDESPFFVMYLADDTREVLDYTYQKDVDTDTNEIGSDSHCGYGSFVHIKETWTDAYSTGFSSSQERMHTQIRTHTGNKFNNFIRTYNISAERTSTVRSGWFEIGSSNPNYCTEEEGSGTCHDTVGTNCISLFGGGGTYVSDLYKGTGIHHRIRIREDNVTGSHNIIFHTDPEAITLYWIKEWGSGSDTTTWDDTYDVALEADYWRCLQEGGLDGPYARAATHELFHDTSTNCDGIVTTDGAVTFTITGPTSIEGEKETNAVLLTPHVAKALDTTTDQDEWNLRTGLTVSQPCHWFNMNNLVSYIHGDMVYWDRPQGNTDFISDNFSKQKLESHDGAAYNADDSDWHLAVGDVHRLEFFGFA